MAVIDRRIMQRRALLSRRRSERKPFRQTRRQGERIRALGVEMDLVRPEEVMLHVQSAIASEECFCVANYNLHGVYLARTNPDFARFCEMADLIEVDSTPLVFLTRILGLHARPFHRCTYLDWRAHFWSLAQREGWKVYYLGGAPGVADLAARRLKNAYPGITLRTRHGFFDASPDSTENFEVLTDINDFAPQVLFVGMGMPRQETWLLENMADLPACVTFNVGAAFDYEAGIQSAAPRWMGRVGLEWVYRLVRDPSRLFDRYCIEPWSLIPVALSDMAEALKQGRLFRGPRSPGTDPLPAPARRDTGSRTRTDFSERF